MFCAKVPVGGAVVCCGKRKTDVVEDISKSYPGRASMSPLLDLLITLLHLGAEGWTGLLKSREEVRNLG